MDSNKNRMPNLTIEADENSSAASPDDRELRIFGDNDDQSSGGANGRGRPRFLTTLISMLTGTLIGVVITLLIVSSRAGGLSNLDVVKNMGEFDTSVISELLRNIETYHFGETPSAQELVDKAAHTIVNSIDDPYATYFTKQEYDDYITSFNGNYYGIGITIAAPDGTGARIHRVYEGSFAEEAGLMAGDLVIEVDGIDVKNVSDNELLSLIKGEDGTTVDITFMRSEEKLTTTVTRGEVYVKRVERYMLDDDIGYLYLSSFSGKAVDEFKEAIEYFKKNKAKSMIVDLRGNPGGSLYTAVDICDLLLPECKIVSLRGKTVENSQDYTSDKNMYDIPFVVLVNDYSASASEIMAGAMQDNERAKIIGIQTYGKGVVQTTFTLSGERGYIKLTTDAYYTPNGTNLGGTGITPDIKVELPDELAQYDIHTLVSEHSKDDTQLQKAIEELTNEQ